MTQQKTGLKQADNKKNIFSNDKQHTRADMLVAKLYNDNNFLKSIKELCSKVPNLKISNKLNNEIFKSIIEYIEEPQSNSKFQKSISLLLMFYMLFLQIIAVKSGIGLEFLPITLFFFFFEIKFWNNMTFPNSSLNDCAFVPQKQGNIYSIYIVAFAISFTFAKTEIGRLEGDSFFYNYLNYKDNVLVNYIILVSLIIIFQSLFNNIYFIYERIRIRHFFKVYHPFFSYLLYFFIVLYSYKIIPFLYYETIISESNFIAFFLLILLFFVIFIDVSLAIYLAFLFFRKMALIFNK